MDARDASGNPLQGDELMQKMAQLKMDPNLISSARTATKEMSLASRNSAFVNKLTALADTRVAGIPFGRFVLPFARISSNVLDQSLMRRTPVAAFSPEVRADLSGANGAVARDTATARVLVGTGLALGLAAFKASGNMSGAAPTDPAKRRVWQLAGNQEYSVKIGDNWYSYQRLGVLGTLMGITADLYDVGHLASEGDMGAAATALTHAFAQHIFNEGPLSGPADLANAITNPQYYGATYIKGLAEGFIPYSTFLAQADRATDPSVRQARGIVDGIRARLPGLSEQLYPKRDIWGEPIANTRGVGPTTIYQQPISQDPASLAMSKLGMGASLPDRTIRNVPLTDEQYDYYSMISGRMAKARLDAIVLSPDWSRFTPDIQRHTIDANIKLARDAARNAVMMRCAAVASQAYRTKMGTLN